MSKHTTASEKRTPRHYRKEPAPNTKKAVFLLAALVIATFCTVFIAAKFSEPTKKMNANTGDNGATPSIGILKASAESVNTKKWYTDEDVKLISKTVYGEALVTNSDTHMSMVVWCILNRVDSNEYGCGKSIEHVVTFPYQFIGYNDSNPVDEHIEWLVRDVLNRWIQEKQGKTDVGRTLPKDYLWFTGNGEYNEFRNAFEYEKAEFWIEPASTPYQN